MDEGPSTYELLGPSGDRITVTPPIDPTCVPTHQLPPCRRRRGCRRTGPHFGPVTRFPEEVRERFLRVRVAAGKPFRVPM